MSNEIIIYFCERYLVMLNFYETISEVISDFVGKEDYENVKKLKEECKRIMELNDIERRLKIKEIISESHYLKIEVDKMEEILKNIVIKI